MPYLSRNRQVAAACATRRKQPSDESRSNINAACSHHDLILQIGKPRDLVVAGACAPNKVVDMHRVMAERCQMIGQ